MRKDFSLYGESKNTQYRVRKRIALMKTGITWYGTIVLCDVVGFAQGVRGWGSSHWVVGQAKRILPHTPLDN